MAQHNLFGRSMLQFMKLKRTSSIMHICAGEQNKLWAKLEIRFRVGASNNSTRLTKHKYFTLLAFSQKI